MNKIKIEKVKETKQHIPKESKTVPIHEDLMEIINQYTNQYPIDKYLTISDKDSSAESSYYIGFFRVKKDTLLAIARQPYVFRLFPDSVCNLCKPIELPDAKGFLLYKDNFPITIFDDKQQSGKFFYQKEDIIANIPKIYELNKYNNPIVPPMWLYKVKKNKLIFENKTDTIIHK